MKFHLTSFIADIILVILFGVIIFITDSAWFLIPMLLVMIPAVLHGCICMDIITRINKQSFVVSISFDKWIGLYEKTFKSHTRAWLGYEYRYASRFYYIYFNTVIDYIKYIRKFNIFKFRATNNENAKWRYLEDIETEIKSKNKYL